MEKKIFFLLLHIKKTSRFNYDEHVKRRIHKKKKSGWVDYKMRKERNNFFSFFKASIYISLYEKRNSLNPIGEDK